jgi:hypothetical protein
MHQPMESLVPELTSWNWRVYLLSDVNWVDPVMANEMTCCICHRLHHDSVEWPGCKHPLCREHVACISTCPQCRLPKVDDSISSISPTVMRVVRLLQLRCPCCSLVCTVDQFEEYHARLCWGNVLSDLFVERTMLIADEESEMQHLKDCYDRVHAQHNIATKALAMARDCITVVGALVFEESSVSVDNVLRRYKRKREFRRKPPPSTLPFSFIRRDDEPLVGSNSDESSGSDGSGYASNAFDDGDDESDNTKDATDCPMPQNPFSLGFQAPVAPFSFSFQAPVATVPHKV